MPCLQESQRQVEVSNKEKEDILDKLAQADNLVAEWKNRVNKLEEDNAKLRRALEQSMTRLNRMSVDSDFLVDRLAFGKCGLLFHALNFNLTLDLSSIIRSIQKVLYVVCGNSIFRNQLDA